MVFLMDIKRFSSRCRFIKERGETKRHIRLAEKSKRANVESVGRKQECNIILRAKQNSILKILRNGENRDSINKLQEICQMLRWALPKYEYEVNLS